MKIVLALLIYATSNPIIDVYHETYEYEHFGLRLTIKLDAYKICIFINRAFASCHTRFYVQGKKDIEKRPKYKIEA